MKTKGEQCVASGAQGAAVQVTFKLDANAYLPGDPVTIKFPGPMSSKTQNRAWVTIVEVGKPPSAYGVWEYVQDGAAATKLVAPTAPGNYEVRLHTEYPAKSHNVVHTVPIKIDPDAQSSKPATTKWRFSIKTKSVAPGEAVELSFAQPMEALPKEKFWVTVVKPDQALDSYGKYEYVPPGARKMLFEMPKEAGDYEVRLHANYPTKSTNVVHRVKIHVGD
jgi:hypothetical protein